MLGYAAVSVRDSVALVWREDQMRNVAMSSRCNPMSWSQRIAPREMKLRCATGENRQCIRAKVSPRFAGCLVVSVVISDGPLTCCFGDAGGAGW